jgi:hypothetical protein
LLLQCFSRMEFLYRSHLSRFWFKRMVVFGSDKATLLFRCSWQTVQMTS